MKKLPEPLEEELLAGYIQRLLAEKVITHSEIHLAIISYNNYHK